LASEPLKKILCPVDFNSASAAVLKIANAMAKEHGAAVCVLHVIVPFLVPPIGLQRSTPLAISERESRSRLEELAARLLEPGVPYTIQIHMGEPAARIVAVAKECGANLIIMATHQRADLGHFVIGGITKRVLRQAPCPVLTIRPTAAA
jgi:universal stress protein A